MLNADLAKVLKILGMRGGSIAGVHGISVAQFSIVI
jgi:hypothetical protein